MRRIVIASAILATWLSGACQTAPKRKKQAPPPRQAVQTVELRHVVVPAKRKAQPSPQQAAVGRVAPDFTLPAYHKGKFTTETLSKHRGKWVLLCFYPGDFTFV